MIIPLHARATDGQTCHGTSGGTIAGIVIGSIAGTLLVLWLIYTIRAASNAPGPRATSEVTRRPRSHHSSRSPRSRRGSRTIYVDESGNRVRAPSKVYYKPE
ncbi:hypothetical protein F5882DRAFT_385309 [Hyaloscypha sp. PMI_1271]|nr:hypothetical protein F5882DRAFT_385309 [Hyaloscypha sp. PMI_1271]